ncbi:MAG: hypothetical protein HY553_06355, partial [Elusimicrobia bacterium]|nr:hypothetical protein [Elusimicrobiota bacterium]
MIKVTAAVLLGMPVSLPAPAARDAAPAASRDGILLLGGTALPPALAVAPLSLARSLPASLAPFAMLPAAVRPAAPSHGARRLFTSLSLPQPAWSEASASELKDGAGDDFARRIGGGEPPAAPGGPGAPPGARVAPETIVAKILPFFARGAGVDPRTGYPYDEWRMGERARRYTQPTAIGQRLELLGHLISGDVAGLPETARARARADARRMLDRLLDDQRRRGHLGLLPWLRLNRKGRPRHAEHGFIDNANLSASVMALLGSVDRAGGDAELERAARRFLDAQAPGYAALFDAKTGLFWGALRPGKPPSGYHVDRFFSEHRAKTAAVVAYFGRAHPSLESAFRGLRPVYRNYRFADATSRDVPATWDGGLFQMSWNVPFESAFYAELPELAR